MSILTLLSSIAAKAVKSFFIQKIASAIATIVPQKMLIAASLLGHTVTIGTRDVAETLIVRGLERLINQKSPLPAKVVSYTESSATIEYEGSGGSSEILRAFEIPHRIDFSVPKPAGLILPQFPPLKRPSFPDFKPRKLIRPDWDKK